MAKTRFKAEGYRVFEMTTELSPLSAFINPNSTNLRRDVSTATAERGEDGSKGRQSAETSEQVERRPSQDEVRRAETIERITAENSRLRRDDNSDLGFKAQQAVAQFSSVENQNEQEARSYVLGIDTFA